ncbi:MAG: hypothetical protein INR65_18610 [Gluconacetobacter diazotrophicus]|nr:hypothetical protein [Gluconacetobacter diazotrophicus]
MVRAATGDRCWGIGRWRVVWPLVLLALAVRIGFGGLAAPAAILDAALEQGVLSAAFCYGLDHRDGNGHPLPPPPADAGDGVLLLGDVLAIAVLPDPGTAAPFPLAPRFIAASPCWCFPPVRGPPFRVAAAALYAQGPPAST